MTIDLMLNKNGDTTGNVETSTLLPVSAMKRIFGVTFPIDGETTTINTELFKSLMQIAISLVQIDENFYLRKHQDVAEAISNGHFRNVRHHYRVFGFYEGRQPFPITVDEDYYLKSNPDIRRSIRDGYEKSGQSHFDRFGWKEGRLPYNSFSLLSPNRSIQ